MNEAVWGSGAPGLGKHTLKAVLCQYSKMTLRGEVMSLYINTSGG